MSREIKATLEKTENIIWEGKQDLASAMISGIFGLVILAAIASFFYFLSSLGGTCSVNGITRPAEECAGFLKYFVYGLFALAVFSPIGTYLRYKVTHYAITNKRIILKSGLIGADMRAVYYDQIKSAFVKVGLVGKIFGTGSILIDTGRITHSKKGSKTVYDRFSNIKEPYAVYKHLQKHLSHRKEGLHSGREDYKHNRKDYEEYVKETEKMRRQVK